MKTTHAIVNYDNAVGFIYDHDKFGKVIILERKAISLEDVLRVVSFCQDEGNKKQDELDLLNVVLNHLGMENKNEAD